MTLLAAEAAWLADHRNGLKTAVVCTAVAELAIVVHADVVMHSGGNGRCDESQRHPHCTSTPRPEQARRGRRAHGLVHMLTASRNERRW